MSACKLTNEHDEYDACSSALSFGGEEDDMGFLDELMNNARERVAEAKIRRDIYEVRRAATLELNRQMSEATSGHGSGCSVRGIATPYGTLFSFGQALLGENIGYVCEIKKASPETGVIVEDFNPIKIASELELAGACAICYAVEPSMYGGSVTTFADLSQTVNVPLVFEDTIVDEYQLYEAKSLGAAGVVLTYSIFDEETLKSYIDVCDSLCLDALVKVRDEEELQAALRAGARIIGADNRDPQTGEVDFRVSMILRPCVPKGCPFVSVSGIQGADDAARVALCDPDAIMVGEPLMRAKLRGLELGKYRYETKKVRLEVERQREEKKKQEQKQEEQRKKLAVPPAPFVGRTARMSPDELAALTGDHTPAVPPVPTDLP